MGTDWHTDTSRLTRRRMSTPQIVSPPDPPPPPPEPDASVTLVDLQRTLSVLTELQQATLAGQVIQTPTIPQAFGNWIRKNSVWVLGIVGALFMGYQEVRDQWRDGQKETEVFRKKTDAAIEDKALELRLHELDAKRETKALQKAIDQVQVGTMQGIEQVQKEIRIVHPSLYRRAPKESEILQKAKAKAKLPKAKASFDDVALPAPPE